MSTISYRNEDGGVTVAYCHFDGDPAGVGYDLREMSYEAVQEIVDEGDMSKIGEPYTSRGESYEDNAPRVYDTPEEAFENESVLYLYVCEKDHSIWMYSDHDKGVMI